MTTTNPEAGETLGRLSDGNPRLHLTRFLLSTEWTDETQGSTQVFVMLTLWLQSEESGLRKPYKALIK